jgi:RNA polymerase sigma-70 factor (ECF subfamily)
MKPALSQDAAAVFDPLRPPLIRVAYRMLGSVADAEGRVVEENGIEQRTKMMLPRR